MFVKTDCGTDGALHSTTAATWHVLAGPGVVVDGERGLAQRHHLAPGVRRVPVQHVRVRHHGPAHSHASTAAQVW